MPVFHNSNHYAVNGTQYGFSGTRIDRLGATEYTLVGIAADVSSSVSAFQKEMERCVKHIVEACRTSPRSDNLMLRLARFNGILEEVHGFKLLNECHPADYDGGLPCGGMTALYDASHNTAESIVTYGKDLVDNDYDCNGILFVITDGMDNRSKMTAAEIAKSIAKVQQEETIESLVSVLIGVNIRDATVSRYLKEFRKDAGFTQYIELKRANPKTLAKLADFVSRSISAQSQSLGTGGPSQSLTF